ncbi:MAG TPA: tRNA pseudouridine synthase A, partial [Clostridia bacterium]|nr:tRNA pseudouridine synthase A [Clostridia bacterium]
GETITLTGGSRTDAGVSALRHVSSFLSNTSIPLERIALAWNTALPQAIAVHDAREVGGAFNPRYDALGKTYRYTVVTGRVRPVIARHFAAYVPGSLDVNAMHEASLLLKGTHDFTSFMDQGSPTRRPVRTLYELGIEEEDRRLSFTFTGDGFLYHMVRILAGTLVSVGQGKIDPDKIATIIESRDRAMAGPTMPAEGLRLERVFFADHLFGNDRWVYEDLRRESKRAHLSP